MSSQTISPNHLDKLVADYKLLRILTPSLKKQVEKYQSEHHLVIEHGNQLYLSLEHIADQKQREHVYQLIQRHQIGQPVELSVLPGELQDILQPGGRRTPLFWGPFLVGGVVGLIIGVLMMAVGTLFMNVSAVTLNAAATPEPINLQIPTIIFVFFAAFSWIITSWFAWLRVKRNL